MTTNSLYVSILLLSFCILFSTIFVHLYCRNIGEILQIDTVQHYNSDQSVQLLTQQK